MRQKEETRESMESSCCGTCQLSRGHRNNCVLSWVQRCHLIRWQLCLVGHLGTIWGITHPVQVSLPNVTTSMWRTMASVFKLHKRVSSRVTEGKAFSGFGEWRGLYLCNKRSSSLLRHLYWGPGHLIAHLLSQTPTDFCLKYNLPMRFSGC